MTVRKDLLERLIRQYNRYADRLMELNTASIDLAERIEELDRYTSERVFWTRSVPGSGLPVPSHLAGALGWLFLNKDWGTALAHGAREFATNPWPVLWLAILLALLVYFRPKLRLAVETAATQVTRPETDNFTVTLKAFGSTLGLAAPVPVAMWMAGLFIAPAVDVDLARAVSRSLVYLAVFSAGLFLVVEACLPGGLVEAHFGRKAAAVRSVRRGVSRLTMWVLPPSFIALTLAAGGMRFHSPQASQMWNNSLGRISFIIATIAFAFCLSRLLRPEAEVMASAIPGSADKWWGRFRHLSAPVLTALALAPAILAVFGYYVSGFLLGVHLVRTLLWTIVFVLASGLLMRWRSLRQRSFRAPARQPSQVETGTASIQVRKLIRFSLSIGWLIGFVAIWSDLVPTFEITRHIQIWPSIQVVRPDSGAKSEATAAAAAPAESKTAPAAQESGRSQAPPVAPGVPGQAPDPRARKVPARLPPGSFSRTCS